MAKFASVSSAEMMAIVRTIGHREADPAVRAADYLAHNFVPAFLRPLLALAPVRWAIKQFYGWRLPGGLPYIVAKSRAIDELVQAVLAAGRVRQFVILGAGYDTRAYRFAEQLKGVSTFEIDHPEIMQRKEARIRQLGIDTASVRYCSADFNADDVFDLEWLQHQGIDPELPTLFVIDGVTYFLTADACANLFAVASRFPAGSEVVFDYAYEEILSGLELRGSSAFLSSLERMGEPVLHGIGRAQLANYIARYDLQVVELLQPDDLRQRFLTDSRQRSTAPYGFLDIARTAKPLPTEAT